MDRKVVGWSLGGNGAWVVMGGKVLLIYLLFTFYCVFQSLTGHEPVPVCSPEAGKPCAKYFNQILIADVMLNFSLSLKTFAQWLYQLLGVINPKYNS